MKCQPALEKVNQTAPSFVAKVEAGEQKDVAKVELGEQRDDS